MRAYDPAFSAMLSTAPDYGLDIRWLLMVKPWSRSSVGTTVTRGFWSGLDDRVFSVVGADGATAMVDAIGDCGFIHSGIPLSSSLDDNPLNINLEPSNPAVESAFREYDLRHAYCELYSILMDGEAIAAPPQLEFVGIIDEAPVTTGSFDSESTISLTIRSEMIIQLRTANPKFSSDSHQKSRLANDDFSKYSGIADALEVKWYQG